MPDGFYEWEELETPLKKLDATLDAYAQAEGMTLSTTMTGRSAP